MEAKVTDPDVEQQGEADREGRQQEERGFQLGEGRRNLERDDQQSERECKNGIGQRFEPRNIAPAPAEIAVALLGAVEQILE